MLHIDFESTKILKGSPICNPIWKSSFYFGQFFKNYTILSIFHNIIIKVVAASSGFCLLVYKMHLLFAWQSSSGFCWMQFCAVHSRRKKINELFSIEEEEEKAITQSTSSLFVFLGHYFLADGGYWCGGGCNSRGGYLVPMSYGLTPRGRMLRLLWFLSRVQTCS